MNLKHRGDRGQVRDSESLFHSKWSTSQMQFLFSQPYQRKGSNEAASRSSGGRGSVFERLGNPRGFNRRPARGGGLKSDTGRGGDSIARGSWHKVTVSSLME